MGGELSLVMIRGNGLGGYRKLQHARIRSATFPPRVMAGSETNKLVSQSHLARDWMAKFSPPAGEFFAPLYEPHSVGPSERLPRKAFQ
jgi:hypothetical protein